MPQSGQNLAPASNCLPQLAQGLGCAAAVPQLGQNFAPDAIAVPQLAHVLAVPPGEAAVGWVIWAPQFGRAAVPHRSPRSLSERTDRRTAPVHAVAGPYRHAPEPERSDAGQ